MEGEEKSEEEETGEESGVIGHQIPDGNASEPCYNLREFSSIGRWKILPAWRMDIGLARNFNFAFPFRSFSRCISRLIFMSWVIKFRRI